MTGTLFSLSRWREWSSNKWCDLLKATWLVKRQNQDLTSNFLTPFPIMVVFAEIPDDVREGNTQSLVHYTSAFVLEQVSCKKKMLMIKILCFSSRNWATDHFLAFYSWPRIVMALGGVPFSLLLFSCEVLSDSLQPHGLQHARLPCPSLSPRVCSYSRPLSWWCCLTISPSVALFFFCLQYFPASGSFPLSWIFESGGQSIGASALASVLPVNIQGWFPLGSTGLITF